ncbi:MAG: hypothetical protein A2096_09275 [Spirochaetes bacterium GWF1_41_5]|nr:MAG: hypothetical protein A2096_09275 [Spirochaetes bacterium GWF1_41_5]HBE02165.1 hypothetical protein [Spirochaetia bacterium]
MKKAVILEYSGLLAGELEPVFAGHGVKLLHETGGIPGISLIALKQPDLIIIDSVLSDASGVDILEFLKDAPEFSAIPVIVFSTVIDKNSSMFFFKADVFLHKEPDLPQKILTSSLNLLEKSSVPAAGFILNKETITGKIDSIRAERRTREKLLEALLLIACSALSVDTAIEKILDFLHTHFAVKTVEYYCGPEKKLWGQEKGTADHEENILLSLPRGQTAVLKVHHAENTSGLVRLGYFSGLIKKIIEQIAVYEHNCKAAEKINLLFSSFLPQKVINSLLQKQHEQSLMTGEKRKITVLFSHIRDFSHIEKNNSTEDVIAFLNRHFTGWSVRIKKHGGEINKFIGDAVFAMFGAPESYEDNELRALSAAREMLDFINEANLKNFSFGPAGYRIGIGIHTGLAIIGNIGSSDNFDYTAIGDTVNLAARLESLNKYYDTDILLSAEVKAACCGNRYTEFREVDTVLVKGKDRPAVLFSLPGREFSDRQFFPVYRKGLTMFRLGNWHLAMDYFTECARLAPADRITGIYLERCREFIKNPPALWNGAFSLGFK